MIKPSEKEEIGRVLAVNLSTKKGEFKYPVDEAMALVDHGLEGDAHAGPGKRQISLLANESIDKMRELGLEGLCFGKFAENITTEGILLYKYPVGTRLEIGNSIQEISQIGKKCHHGCEVAKQIGMCIMPKEGLFTIVIESGTVKPGDVIKVL